MDDTGRRKNMHETDYILGTFKSLSSHAEELAGQTIHWRIQFYKRRIGEAMLLKPWRLEPMKHCDG